ncbi:hypothetical protein [Trujillonella endophytica]|uniref:Transcriptional regulator, AbiEi antitoxin, Type IV TA system n=1 Tax=Trujillonella endophytica TaxID=673521 RepID=A0A1H8SJ41_9ACTN|nr:hypothetical protein [Trujillella endophytica]SEO78536.1 Transcriptional regulator, AbiEi antitoxin, Type IV TA system [Trujillella endophytica]
MDLWQDRELLLRRDLVADGWSDDELARCYRTGELSRIRRGAYVPGSAPLEPATRYRRLITSTVAGLRRDAVVSHQSAALLHGFPLWRAPLDRVHVTRRPPASTDRSSVLHVHVAAYRDEEVHLLDGLLVTDPVRTALDLARTQSFETAVVALDAGLRTTLLQAALVQQRLDEIGGLRGSRAAARAVAASDRRSGSVGETRSRLLLQRLGLAPTGLQYSVLGAGGTPIGWTDFVWEGHRRLGEFDGKVKYGRLLRPGQQPGDAVFDEKRREDAMRDEGFGMTRWTWSEIDARILGPRIRRAMDRCPR